MDGEIKQEEELNIPSDMLFLCIRRTTADECISTADFCCSHEAQYI